jgi:hypothetical protein
MIEAGQAIRTSPRGSACRWAITSAAASASTSIAAQWAWKLRPISVTAKLRVVRWTSRTPSRSSRSAMRRLMRERGRFSSRAAAAKPPRSTTVANRRRSFRSSRALFEKWDIAVQN